MTQLGKMLLDDVDYNDRLRCALIVRVEERKLLEVCNSLLIVVVFVA